ncbi:type II secretion system protein GspC [Thiohalorhabdus methylotrophus]|uniref:Type II secretion system protein GspC n=1 Tax=Thiohalorhabdus methylotrophus TaxID=3242694 RepID=A0ABV4TXJ6_9GAMM
MAHLSLPGVPHLFSRFSASSGIRMAETVLVLALSVALADFTWDLLPGPSRDGKGPGAMAAKPSAGAPRDRSAAERGASGNLRTVPESVRSLFGTPPEAQAQAGRPVRETRLDLTLKGILANQREGGRQLAIIASGKEEEKVYRVGDAVPGGAEIVRIESRRVILRRNGVTEALTLEVKELEGQRTGLASSSQGGGNGVRKVGQNRRVVSQSALRSNLKNLPSLLRQAKAVPHSLNGHRAGFRIVNIQPGSIYEELGLREGDVVQSVNGKDIRTPGQALNAYRELKSAEEFKVRLKRNGQDRTLTYSVR